MKAFPVLVAGLLMAASAPLTASALTVDFTDEDAFSNGDFSEVISGRLISLSSTGGPLNIDTQGPGPIGALPLQGESDGVGVGVGDDEVLGGSETITIDFGGLVEVVGIHLLDFFFETSSKFEIAFINETESTIQSFEADATDNIGYFFSTVVPKIVATSIVLSGPVSVNGNNGDDGNHDFALAGVDINIVPIPASLALLLGAVGGLGVLSRRRRAA